MPTIEERLQALEQEIVIRKQTEEMLTIAVRALVSKEAFENLQDTIKESQEQNGKLFNVLINQGTLHNERMTNLQGQIIDLDGNVKRLHTEMQEARGQIIDLDGNVKRLHTEMQEARGQIIDLDGNVKRLHTEMQETRGQIIDLDGNVKRLHTEMHETRGDITDLKSIAQQLLARLPEQP